MERVGRSEYFERELFVLEASTPDAMPAVLPLLCPYFACLIAWDARQASSEVLKEVANKLLGAGCVYVCFWGPDCERVHDWFDTAELELRPDGPWAMSTWHSNEPLSEALWFLLAVTAPDDEYYDGCRASIGITIGSPAWAAQVRTALSDPSKFIRKVLAGKKE